MTVEESATNQAQDINSRIENVLYVEDEKEPEQDEVVSDDAEELPEDDDTENDDGSEDEVVDNEEEADLASLLGVEPERIIESEDGDIQISAKIDGEIKNVNLKDLVSSYQLQGHVNNKSMALEKERKEFEEARSNIAQTMKSKMEDLSALNKAMEEQLLSEYNAIDWDKLRVSDSSEWTALRQEFAEKAQNIQRIQADIVKKADDALKEQEKAQGLEHEKALQAEMQKLIQLNPSWADTSKFNEDIVGIREFAMNTYGYTEEDLSGISDHRVIRVLQDAMAFKNGSKSAEAKKSKIVPKFQKSGISKQKAEQLSKARNVKAKKDAIKKSKGHVRDVANLIVDRM